MADSPLTQQAYLQQFHANVDQRQAAYDPRESGLYLKLDDQAVRGTDSRELIAADIEFTLAGATLVLSGPRGSGKSSELLQLGRDFEAEGRIFLYADAEWFLNRSDPLDDGALLVAIVAGIVDAAARRNSGGAAADGEHLPADQARREMVRLRQPFMDMLKSFRFGETTVNIDLGLISLSQALQPELSTEQSDARARIKNLMTTNRREFKEALHQVVREAVATVVRRSDGMPVFVFDSLDHWRGTYANYREVRDSVERIFQETSSELCLPGLNTVYVVPPHVNPGWCPRHFLYNVKVADRNQIPSADGVDAMRQVLRQRAPGFDLDRLLDDDGTADVIAASGGHFRTLMHLMTHVTLAARHSPLPASADHVAQAEQAQRSTIAAGTTAEQLAILRQVADDPQFRPRGQDLYDYDALEVSGAVLRYKNGDEWLAVHPLLRSFAG